MRDAPRNRVLYDARKEIDAEGFADEDGEKSYYMGSTTEKDLSYGWIYTSNESEENVLKNQISLSLEGLEVAYPAGIDASGPFDITVEPESDHLIILRKTAKDVDLNIEVTTYSVE